MGGNAWEDLLTRQGKSLRGETGTMHSRDEAGDSVQGAAADLIASLQHGTALPTQAGLKRYTPGPSQRTTEFGYAAACGRSLNKAGEDLIRKRRLQPNPVLFDVFVNGQNHPGISLTSIYQVVIFAGAGDDPRGRADNDTQGIVPEFIAPWAFHCKRSAGRKRPPSSAETGKIPSAEARQRRDRRRAAMMRLDGGQRKRHSSAEGKTTATMSPRKKGKGRLARRRVDNDHRSRRARTRHRLWRPQGVDHFENSQPDGGIAK